METHASLGRCEDAKHREVVQKKIAIYLLHTKRLVRLKSEVSKRSKRYIESRRISVWQIFRRSFNKEERDVTVLENEEQMSWKRILKGTR
jgi:hypothetical protein